MRKIIMSAAAVMIGLAVADPAQAGGKGGGSKVSSSHSSLTHGYNPSYGSYYNSGYRSYYDSGYRSHYNNGYRTYYNNGYRSYHPYGSSYFGDHTDYQSRYYRPYRYNYIYSSFLPLYGGYFPFYLFPSYYFSYSVPSYY